jgi:ATP-binding cassette subfamily B protein
MEFFRVLPQTNPGLVAGWVALLLRGILPAAFAIARGARRRQATRPSPRADPRAFVGAIWLWQFMAWSGHCERWLQAR